MGSQLLQTVIGTDPALDGASQRIPRRQVTG